MKKVLIVSLVGIGDHLLSRVFMKSLRDDEKYKHAKFTLLGNTAFKDFSLKFDMNIFNHFIWVDCNKVTPYVQTKESTYTKIKNKAIRFYIRNLIKHSNFDEIIVPDWWGASTTLRVTPFISSVRDRAIINGMNIPDHQREFFGYSTKPDIDFSNHVLDMNKEFFSEIIPFPKFEVEIPLKNKNKDSGKIDICISLGASAPFKKYPVLQLANVINSISSSYNANFKIIGSNDEISDYNVLIEHIDNKDIVAGFVGRTTLSESCDIVLSSELLIANDTGMFHVGALAGIKTVCISNGTGLHAFVPYPEEFSNCITVFPPEIQNKVGTKDFINAHGWSGSAIPMSNISPDDVLAACYKLLNKK